jgi:tetratricopeptide (TPR) repeat protein
MCRKTIVNVLLALFLLTVVSIAAQRPTAPTPSPSGQKAQQRDLVYETEAAAAARNDNVVIPRSYALIVAIAQYKSLRDDQQLRFSERDADSIYATLISPEGGNFPAQNVEKLIGSNATLANIRSKLEQWLPSVAGEEDRVLIYFAGHGFVADGRAYLAPYDFSPADIAGTGYSMDDLGKVFGSQIKAKWKVLLADACHSGAINPGADSQMFNQSLIDVNRSVFSLTASRDREISFESPDWGGGHGIFTYYVVKGLEGEADESRDGIVTADELAEYVRRNVREATGGRQNPTSERASFDPNMLLAYVASRRTPDAPQAPKFGTFIIEANIDSVEVFIDGQSVGVVSKGKPLRLPGLTAGAHTVKGVKTGYEPDGPREEVVYPGQDHTVSIKILIARRRGKDAVEVFDRGVEYYTKGRTENYRRAVDELQKALQLDPNYSQAALYLARSYNALLDQENAKKFFQRAIEIDPDYMEARASFAGMLLDIGDVDEAIRQLNTVTRRNSDSAQAFYLLSEAFRMKEAYSEAINAGRKATHLNANNAEAHFWLAEGLRMSQQYSDARAEYLEYLRLSDFDSKLAGNLNYYVLGFVIGKGKKKRASQHDIWEDLRSLAYFGLCDSERRLEGFDRAIQYCLKSLTYDSQDPYTHYALGLAYSYKGNALGGREFLVAARQHFQTMLDLNSDISEAEFARKNIRNIDAALTK